MMTESDQPTPQPPLYPTGVETTFELDGSVEGLKLAMRNHLVHTLAVDPTMAAPYEWWSAVCLTVRDRIMERSCATRRVHRGIKVKRAYYLSLEYLMGRLLENNLVSAGMLENTRTALVEMGQDIETVFNQGNDMGLGNGGLGRLAACFMDSLATLDLPAVGYGINYEFGLFRQSFVKGRQVESPDEWRKFGNPWEIVRPDWSFEIKLYGRVEQQFDDVGESTTVWTDTQSMIGVPWDIPIAGYGCGTINILRLWESRASKDFDLEIFNEGGYVEAVREKALSETVSKVLYPNDETESGKELRLVQQYFFVACSLQDILMRHRRENGDLNTLPDKAAIQLNDTHPAVAVAELMRLLIDQEGMDWNQAWALCQRTFSYTNHTLLPEALERWSVPLFEKVLPRHLQIIYEINRRFLSIDVEAKWPGDDAKKADLSIIEEGYPKNIRMAHLAVIGSHATNGVAALHTQLLKKHLFHDFDALYPGRIQNKTNGITPRRWLRVCNPGLSNLIDRSIGDDWPRNLDRLRDLEPFIENPNWREEFRDIKRQNKQRLGGIIQKLCGVTVSENAIFDVQIKRLHEYKRQHLNLLNILTQYRRLLHNPDLDVVPRVFIFGAKAAPGYVLAKQIIHAINAVADKINNDARIQDKLKVAFLPNYGVSLAERIIPAADISEQISTAGKEASGTGNMKLALNGALTIGTLDGANVEIGEEVGSDNIFIFGLTVEEVEALWKNGYSSMDYYWNNEELREIIDWLCSDHFSGTSGSFDKIRSSLLEGGDPFLVLADYDAYVTAQARVDLAYRDADHWSRMAALNTARVGKFSSDRTIQEYADQIWNLAPVSIG
ncbi:MAG: glycogen/starch/alpha-glucan phosphorylase [Verrucomicrobiae bacterium]|nr:glycogen/starch/alpha-glucan phosphorylase [Verrucomicrobiae bacterium]